MIRTHRINLLATLVSATLWSSQALADETAPPGDFTLSGNVSAVSQYRARGIAQSDNKPAVQATLTLSHKSGFYVTAWGSTTKTGDGPIDLGGSEVDLFAGFTHEIGTTGLVIDTGFYGFIYPDASPADYYEIYGSLTKTLGPASAKIGIAWAPPQKVFDQSWNSPTRHNAYIYADLGSGVPGTPITLHAHLGHNGGGLNYAKPYLDYAVGATWKWQRFSLDASLVGTNISHADVTQAFWPRYAGLGRCTAASACTDWFHRMVKTAPVVSLSYGF